MANQSFATGGKETPILPRLPKELRSVQKPPVIQPNVPDLQRNSPTVPNYVNLVYQQEEEPYVLPPRNLHYDLARRKVSSRSLSADSAYARRKSIASIISTKLNFESIILWRILVVLVFLLVICIIVSVFFYVRMQTDAKSDAW